VPGPLDQPLDRKKAPMLTFGRSRDRSSLTAKG
jgi:hypothetical protein